MSDVEDAGGLSTPLSQSIMQATVSRLGVDRNKDAALESTPIGGVKLRVRRADEQGNSLSPNRISIAIDESNRIKEIAWIATASHDLAEWLNGVFVNDNVIFDGPRLLEKLSDGVWLQKLAQKIDDGENASWRWEKAAGEGGIGSPRTIHTFPKQAFLKRDNVTQFLKWAALLEVPDHEVIKFEADDLVEMRNPRQVLLYLLGIASKQTWIPPPQVAIQDRDVEAQIPFTDEMKTEIDEIASQCIHGAWPVADQQGRYNLLSEHSKYYVRRFQYSDEAGPLGTPNIDAVSGGLRVRLSKMTWITLNSFMEAYGYDYKPLSPTASRSLSRSSIRNSVARSPEPSLAAETSAAEAKTIVPEASAIAEENGQGMEKVGVALLPPLGTLLDVDDEQEHHDGYQDGATPALLEAGTEQTSLPPPPVALMQEEKQQLTTGIPHDFTSATSSPGITDERRSLTPDTSIRSFSKGYLPKAVLADEQSAGTASPSPVAIPTSTNTSGRATMTPISNSWNLHHQVERMKQKDWFDLEDEEDSKKGSIVRPIKSPVSETPLTQFVDSAKIGRIPEEAVATHQNVPSPLNTSHTSQYGISRRIPAEQTAKDTFVRGNTATTRPQHRRRRVRVVETVTVTHRRITKEEYDKGDRQPEVQIEENEHGKVEVYTSYRRYIETH